MTQTRPDPDDSGPADALPLEPHPDLPVLGSLAGTWVWDVVQDRWNWSDEVYVIHGFQPRQVVPTTDLVFSHKHPDDLAKVKGVLAHALDTGDPFACQHRILDARRRERTVLAMGRALVNEHGHISALSGFMTDLTHTRRQDLEPVIQSAINGVVANRAVIEQAKGALMVIHGIDEDAAFDLLRTASSSSNRKLRDIASAVVEQMRTGAPGDDPLVAALLTPATAE
jgi:hypothetical protein